MIVRLELWNVADSLTNIEELRRDLRDESVEQYDRVPGLLFQSWISDEVTDRWGSIYVWESQEAAEQELPTRARELIGKDPDIVEVFDLEATVAVAPELAHLGLAFDGMSAVRVERDGPVLRIVLARPERRNAFDAAVIGS